MSTLYCGCKVRGEMEQIVCPTWAHVNEPPVSVTPTPRTGRNVVRDTAMLTGSSGDHVTKLTAAPMELLATATVTMALRDGVDCSGDRNAVQPLNPMTVVALRELHVISLGSARRHPTSHAYPSAALRHA
jgi:hypothetical protein